MLEIKLALPGEDFKTVGITEVVTMLCEIS